MTAAKKHRQTLVGYGAYFAVVAIILSTSPVGAWASPLRQFVVGHFNQAVKAVTTNQHKAQKDAKTGGLVNPPTKAAYGFVELPSSWTKALPAECKPYARLIYQAGKDNNIDARLEAALIRHESDCNVLNPIGPHGVTISFKNNPGVGHALGIGQLLRSTADKCGINPYNNRQNLECSAHELRAHLDRWNERLSYGIAAYNAGDGDGGSGGVAHYGLAAAYPGYIAGIESSYRSYGGHIKPGDGV